MKAKLKIISLLGPKEDEEEVSKIRKSLCRRSSFGPDYLVQLREILESHGLTWSPENWSDLKLYCFSRGSNWKILDGVVTYVRFS